MTIDSPKIEDIDQIYQIELDSYGNEESTDKETFCDILNYPEHYVGYKLIALKDNKQVIGFYYTIEENKNIDLVDIAIHKDYRNFGYGKKLLKHCIDTNQNKTIHLVVRDDNTAAIKLYESFSFKKSSIEKDYYGDCDGIRFTLAL